MFELSVAFKYLIPRKKQLSASLIALLSVTVISLVVWLVLVFLSVTEGIERNWLQKLTTLNAPLRITPTSEYYDSYYYQVDGISGDAGYTLKGITEKAEAPTSDPYLPLQDGEIPARFPEPDYAEDGSLKDPVKGLFALLSELNKAQPITFQEFELGGALMRLQLLRPGESGRGEGNQGYLTQVSYLASIPDQCPKFSSLVVPPTAKDLNHLIYLASHSTDLSRQDSPALSVKAPQERAHARIEEILRHAHVTELKPRHPLWQISADLLPASHAFEGRAHVRGAKLSRIDIPVSGSPAGDVVKLWKEGGELYVEDKQGRKEKIPLTTPLLVDGPITWNAEELSSSLLFRVRGYLQGALIQGDLPLDGLEITKADGLSTLRELPINAEKESGVLIAKSFLESGVMIGDRGYLSYSSATSGAVQEHRLPIFVAGFYDPGILSVGSKCILVPPFITRTINASSSSFNLDKTQSSGILVWFEDLGQVEQIKNQILGGLKAQGLEKYWKVTTFRTYPFAKDLLEQFQSDKYLFTLIGIILLTVACCNIISMLILLVNDKKREIGTLQAMGASSLSIAAIFGICGITMGILSSLIGIGAALLTLHHIDPIVQLLGQLQGHSAFNATFFGDSLPGALSTGALLFVLIATPLLSLLAGLIPAIKACRLRPSAILRAE